MKTFILFFLFIMAGLIAKGQNAINGLVRSAADSLPVPGATVKFVGTRYATFTNEKGRFSLIQRGSSGVLEVSAVGQITRQIAVSTRRDTFLVVTLDPAINQLNDVVVSTGYQALSKERATGSFSLVDRKQLNQQVSTDILSRLEATANGLTVDRGTNGTATITIRGLSTIRGPRAPLVVIDNFPYDGDINNINPNDIETVTVLKDAAASSIWGARASNGVIVITTRKARLNQPIAVDFNANLTVESKPDLSYIRQMSSSDFIDVEQTLYRNGYYSSWINSANHRVLSNVVELLNGQDKGTVSAASAAKQIDALRTIDVRDDFNRYVYQRAFNQQYALSLRGVSDKISWNASGGYDHNVSNLDANYRRVNLRYQQNYVPFKNLELSTGIYLTRSDQKNGKLGYGNIVQYTTGILPYTQLADADGNPLAIPRKNSLSYLVTAGNGRLLDWKYYPLDDFNYTRSTSALQDVVLNTGLVYRLPWGFGIDLRYQYERQSNDYRNLQDAGSYYARDLVNSFTQLNASGNPVYIIPRGGVLDLSNNLLQSHNIRAQLNYRHQWGKNDINAIGGYEVRRATNTGNSNRLYGYNDDLLTFGNVDYVNPYPDFISGNTGYIVNNQGIDERRTNFISTYANASYSYDQKYTLSLSARRDASNLFGLNTNDQWNPFASVGLSWLASEETFYKLKWLPYLRLRATYGFSGNIDPAMSAATTIQYNSTSPFTNGPIARFINYTNPELRWETSRMLNTGLDFRLFGDRVSGSFEYYQKRGKNLFGTALVDYTTGIGSTVIKNVASMKGSGFDLQLTTQNLQGALNWSSTLNLSHYQDQVTDYYLGSTIASSFVSGNATISGIPGRPVYSIFAFKWSGLDPQNGDPIGILNGSPSKDYTAITGTGTNVNDLTYYGSAIPTWFGSFNHSVNYKQLFLNFSLIYKLGYYFRRQSVNYSELFNNWQGHSDYALRWQNAGDEVHTSVPSLSYPANSARDAFYLSSEPLVEKADHVRFQYINFGYEISKKNWRSLPFKSLQMYFNINNLGVIWRANKHGIDPDYASSFNALPVSRSYSIGLRATIN